ncbi:hypothetical protein PENSPDRAFT_751111 [Peniophora sp. CONT]|nr:hypothetical protein PENSPDRAFT_751111 [Peniophora sp. CONT]
MAQAVFEDHPLESYLRQTGEDTMPGAVPGLLPENAAYDDSEYDDVPEATMQDLLDLLPEPLVRLIQALLSELSTSHTLGQEQALAERFKYDIISSSLLAASISPPTSAHDRSFSSDMPNIPGSSTPDDDDAHSPSAHVPLSVVVLSICTLLSVLSGSLVLAILFGSSVYYLHVHAHNPGRSIDGIKPTMSTLNELIAASNLWESTVHEVHALIEDEESSIYHGSPTTSSSPSSALRVALLSALQTTQSQCDNVRHLLSALTSPSALSQMAEMYAPPSPVRPALELLADPGRPVTMPVRERQRVLSAPTDKRSTWSGNGGLSYSALASAGSPSRHALRRREKRRSDLSALLETSRPTSSSAPVTPDLNQLREEDEDEVQEITIGANHESHFGSSALHLRKMRRISGMEALGFPSPASASASAIDRLSSPPPHPSLRHSRSFGHTARASSVAGSATSPATASSSRFTTVQTTRHPLSLSSINNALSGAISAKRYAAAHLLALRFEEEEDEQYWGDVRAIMSLLASSLAEATARLTSSLDKDERTRMNAQIPTPLHSPRVSLSLSDAIPRRRSSGPQSTSFGAGTSSPAHSHGTFGSVSSNLPFSSFAPMPNQFGRFAQHVDAVNTALSDARENLESCVAALRDDERSSPGVHEHERSDSLSEVTSHPAVLAYERLRRELGLALRECERGRERLLDLVSPPPPVHSDSDSDGGDEHRDEVPALASDDSDRADSLLRYAAPRSPAPGSPTFGDAVLVHSGPPPLSDAGVSTALEALLVPSGIEQVFEAEPDALVAMGRERSKVSREERIRLAKLKRESVQREGEGGKGGKEKWGPGEDVVDELRDVIWKVGERRRKMMEMHEAVEDEEGEGEDDVAVGVAL